MFSDFFYGLKKIGVPVTLTEWITFHEALSQDLALSSPDRFYYLSRSLLVKTETHFDKFDRVFLHVFKGIETPEEMVEKILEGLKEVPELVLTEEEKALLEALDLDEVRRRFEEQYKEGHFDEHVGGNKAIGTGGRSTQGAFGYNPAGVRIGQGRSRHKKAIQVAEERRFANYSSDMVLDVRQFKVALSRLRTLIPIGPEEELDLEKTIDETCKKDDLTFVWERSKENSVKLVLLMDTGGSMWPYAELVSRLFSASRSLFGKLRYYYFHNCVYQDIWTDMGRNKKIKTEEILKNVDPDSKIIFVGDASMAPSELTHRDGAIDYWYSNDIPGLLWLDQFRQKFKNCAWLNPEPVRNWRHVESISLVREVFEMYPLTLDGLQEAVKDLMQRR